MKKAVVIPIVAVFLAACFVFPCSAADVFVADSFEYWSEGNYSWSGGAANGTQFNFSVNPYESTLDWNLPFPDHALVGQRYVKSVNQGIRLSVSQEPDPTVSYYNYSVYVHFKKPMNFVADMTYTFFMRCSELSVYSSNGNVAVFNETLNRVGFIENGTDNYMTVTRSTVSNYGDCYEISYKPSSNHSTSDLYFHFSNSGTLAMYHTVTGSLTFSNMVSYTGDLSYVQSNPQLGSIDDQLSDLNSSIQENPYGEITGVEPADPYDDIDQDDSISKADTLLNNLSSFLADIPANVGAFWKNLVEFLFSLPIFIPFITLGVGILVNRMLIGR